MGCNWVITSNGLVSAACTMFPTSTSLRSDAAADGRRDVRVHQVQLRIVDRCLVGPNRSLQLIRGGPLRIHLLARHCSRIIQQTLEALIIQARVLQLGLVTE